jgi:hypothetical protein
VKHKGEMSGEESLAGHLKVRHGGTIAQAVSRWLPTAAALVRAWSGHVEFMLDKVALGQVFPEYFVFP